MVSKGEGDLLQRAEGFLTSKIVGLLAADESQSKETLARIGEGFLRQRFFARVGDLRLGLRGKDEGLLAADESQSKETFAMNFTYLALGDSYTIGESVTESERWPVQVADLLRSRGITMSGPDIIAQTGWTSDELTDSLNRANLSGTYDVVSLLIGVNNQYRGRTAENYRGEFRGLLQRAIGFAGNRPGRVVVLSIPDWGITPFAAGQDTQKIAKEIDDFNAVNFEETVRAGAQYVDVTPISREATRDPSLLASDGLHPSGKMYAVWAHLAEPKFLNALSLQL